MSELHNQTPTVLIWDNRNFKVRDINYYRHPDQLTKTDERITIHTFNNTGFLISSLSPRQADQQQHNPLIPADRLSIYSLNGNVLCSKNTDDGTTVTFKDVAERNFFTVSATGVKRNWQYESLSSGRPISVTEQIPGEAIKTTERFIWAENSQLSKSMNLAGQCISHYDTSGVEEIKSQSLTGDILARNRRLLSENSLADWSGTNSQIWDNLLSNESFLTTYITDATGVEISHTDAQGNVKRQIYNVAGLVKSKWIKLTGKTEKPTVKSITYSASGQILSEEAGNGIITTYRYEPETQRLIGIRTQRPAGHQLGAKILQDLRYDVDPVGNILNVRNDAEATRFWRNQKIEPENTFVYDSLYQLIKATGREMAGAAQSINKLPSPMIPIPDNSTYTNYTRSYSYDRNGNLTQIQHSAPAVRNSYTTRITVSSRSNRAVLSTLTENSDAVESLFDAGGRQLQLVPGQTLVWNGRGELQEIIPVTGETESDSERYHYGADSQRIIKTTVQRTGNNTQRKRVVYLPELERREKYNGTSQTEAYDVVISDNVRILHWDIGLPNELSNDRWYYSHRDLIGSAGLETDDIGHVVSCEEFYPYGGTAVWAGRSLIESSYKTIRYSGKERDITGLYYYGYRYYQPWVCRWLSPDPAGAIDGLNLFKMVNNNPVTYKDVLGLINDAALKLIERNVLRRSPSSLAEVKTLLQNFQLSAADTQDVLKHFESMPQFSPNQSANTATATASSSATTALEKGVQSLSLSDKKSEEFRTKYIADEKNFKHIVRNNGFVYSTSVQYPKETYFHNKFTAEKWEFGANFRRREEPFFASDITKYQYGLASKKGGFEGVLPKILERQQVQNVVTLQKTEGKTGDELLNAFINETPNGRSTQRILNIFGLKATKVERKQSWFDGIDFTVHVVPKSSVDKGKTSFR